MKIWLISPYGPIPGEGWRDYRFALMSSALAQSGHQAIWWTPNFSHHFKEYRSESWSDRPMSSGWTLRLVPTTSYSRNISFGRLRYEANFVRNLRNRALTEERPDCIIATEPPQVTGRLGLQLALHFDCPLVLDVMDQWPELFEIALPRILRPLSRIAFAPFYIMRRHNLRSANGLLSLCETYHQLALREAPGLLATPNATIFNGIPVQQFRSSMSSIPSENAISLPGKPSSEVWAVYAGTLGNNYDIKTLLAAAELCRETCSNLRFLVAGSGPLLPLVRAYVERSAPSNMIFLGHLVPFQLAQVYAACDIGLCIYAPGSNVAMPDKAYDYMAAGLPIVNSLPGELAQLLNRAEAGVQYEAGNVYSLIECLRALTEDAERRSRMAACSFQSADQFDSVKQYSVLPDVVEAVCANRFRSACSALPEVQPA